MSDKPTGMRFEKRYSDDSGVEHGVYFDVDTVTLESIDSICFPVSEIPWLIACLERIQAELPESEA